MKKTTLCQKKVTLRKLKLLKMDIGNNIKRIREFKNLTQEYIATQLGISRQTYMMIESGQTDVKFENIKKIAALLDVSVNDIIAYNDKMVLNNRTNSNFGYNYQAVSVDEKELYQKLLVERDLRLKQYEDLLKAKDQLIDSLKK